MAKTIEAQTQAVGKPPEWKYFETTGAGETFRRGKTLTGDSVFIVNQSRWLKLGECIKSDGGHKNVMPGEAAV